MTKTVKGFKEEHKDKDENNLFSAKSSFIRIRNYLAGRFVGATRDEVLLHELTKILLCKLIGNSKLENINGSELVETYKNIFLEIKNKYSDIFGKDEEILLDSQAILYLNEELRSVKHLQIDRDPIGDAYEVFIGNVIRGQEGQFFTPRNAAKLLVEAIDPKPGEKIIDPACGSGGFLVLVLQHFLNKGLTFQELIKASKNVFGIDKDQYLCYLSKIHIIALTTFPANIFCEDSLIIGKKKHLNKIQLESFDVILTNPPFGSGIISADYNTLTTYQLAKKWIKKSNGTWASKGFQNNVPPQVLFLEQCISFAKVGGRIGIVVPESLISSKKYEYVVEYIKNNCIIKAVIGMPEVLFKTSGKGGTHTKTCLLMLEKIKIPSYKIFLAEAKWCGHDSRGKQIPYDDLPLITENIFRYNHNMEFNKTNLGFIINSDQLINNVLAPRYYDPEIIKTIGVLKLTHKLITFEELINSGCISVKTGDEVGKLAYSSGDIPFIRTSDISNWEIKIDPKHCISRELYESLKSKQDVQPLDILMVRDGTYLIGKCALITEYDVEIVYQSHLLKIRVHENKCGINPYLLLAILSSDFVQRQIKTKCFTQDIIDSLGDRYKELILPIPKSGDKVNNITQMVKDAIENRIKARELCKKATIEILA
ncbi:MAG: N-6 DNA methylase [Candidatus Bathyarchaeia archaeon]